MKHILYLETKGKRTVIKEIDTENPMQINDEIDTWWIPSSHCFRIKSIIRKNDVPHVTLKIKKKRLKKVKK